MQQTLLSIAKAAIRANQPNCAVQAALAPLAASPCAGKTILISVGKAAWDMAQAAAQTLEGHFCEGWILTKYGHSRGSLEGFTIFEAGHPVPDAAGVDATRQIEQRVQHLGAEDRVIFLLSGGGSALFEDPLIPLETLRLLTEQLLSCGADIGQINAIRKKLSAVKGGRFGALCAPAQVWTIVLSDVVGDRPDLIASGPTCPDPTPEGEALRIAERYGLPLSDRLRELLSAKPVRSLPNAKLLVTGGVGQLCMAAKDACEKAGYPTQILTDTLTCEAREAGRLLGSIAAYHARSGGKRAFVAGGETVVHLKGSGLGGRNQELALAAALPLDGVAGAALLSIGSDGTDGPTDAAGGWVDGGSLARLRAAGIQYDAALEDNDAYHALQACGGLIKTGPTGTNVNDLVVILIDTERTPE